jgi:hypothetical protein
VIVRTLTACAAVLLLGLQSGCASGQEDDVSTVSARFYHAVADQDGAAACDVLAPDTKSELEKTAQKPCDQAILEEDVPSVASPRTVEAFGTMAKVDFGGETAFLARFQGGWKVMAAGCSKRPDHPYDCVIQGG